MIYILLDNYDQGLELEEVKDFDELAKYLEHLREFGDSYDRIQHIIFGEEVPWDVVRTYYSLKE